MIPGGTGAESGLIFVGDVMSLVDGIRVASVSPLHQNHFLPSLSLRTRVWPTDSAVSIYLSINVSTSIHLCLDLSIYLSIYSRGLGLTPAILHFSERVRLFATPVPFPDYTTTHPCP